MHDSMRGDFVNQTNTIKKGKVNMLHVASSADAQACCVVLPAGGAISLKSQLFCV